MPDYTCRQADEGTIHLAKKHHVTIAAHLGPLEENFKYRRDDLKGSIMLCFFLFLADQRPIVYLSGLYLPPGYPGGN